MRLFVICICMQICFTYLQTYTYTTSKRMGAKLRVPHTYCMYGHVVCLSLRCKNKNVFQECGILKFVTLNKKKRQKFLMVFFFVPDIWCVFVCYVC